MRETVVLDTSVILSDFNSLRSYPGKDVVICWTVLTELDKNKTRNDEVGINAREAHRILDSLQGDFEAGVDIGNDIVIRLIPDQQPEGRSVLKVLNPDDKILATAYWLKIKCKKVVKVISQDLNFRIKAKTLGIETSGYSKDSLVRKDELFTGYQEIVVDPSMLARFHALKELEVDLDNNFYPNEFIMLKSSIDEKSTGLGIYKKNKNAIVKIEEKKMIRGIRPKNREQQMATHLLMDKDIHLVTMFGTAGTGKTLLCLAAALEQIDNGNGYYEKIVITKALLPVGGKDIGYLPGSKEEKLRPWMASIVDNLRHLVKHQGELDNLENSGILEFEALAMLRGRNIPRSIIMIDEAQNLSRSDMKTILTRAGTGSKVILTADTDQIDQPKLDSVSNGAAQVAEAFKEFEISGNIVLLKGERSELATLAAKIL